LQKQENRINFKYAIKHGAEFVGGLVQFSGSLNYAVCASENSPLEVKFPASQRLPGKPMKRKE